MDRPSSSYSAVTTMLNTMIQFALFVGGLAFAGLAISTISQPHTLEPHFLEKTITDDCTSNLFEYKMTLVFASISCGCIMMSVPVMAWIKMELAHRFREEVDAMVSVRTAVTSVIRQILFFTQVLLVVGFASAVLTVFYTIQVKSRKFYCMGYSIQAGMTIFMGIQASLMLLGLHSMYLMTFRL